MPLNRAEELVQNLCTKTFLSLWSIPNPIACPGKELCDVLIVCDPDVLIWSVKEIALKDLSSGSKLERWSRKAIRDSIKQLYGGERQLARMNVVSNEGNSCAIPLPPIHNRRVHRIAVALGSQGAAPIPQCDFGKGFIHVLNEDSLNTLLCELNTITDFRNYLCSKEELITRTQVYLDGTEEDFLGVYIREGRRFPVHKDVLHIGEGIWAECLKDPQWLARKQEDELSYFWDRLIELFAENFHQETLIEGQSFEEIDAVMRIMTREDRFSRRLLSLSFTDFIKESQLGRSTARIAPSPSGVCYVFLATSRDLPRDQRREQLAGRCWVARGMHLECTTVIGIATERYIGKPGFSFDALRLVKEDWTSEDEEVRQHLQQQHGFFRKLRQTPAHIEEFPKLVSNVA